MKLKFSLKRLSTLIMLSTICIVARIYFQWIPNVQPVTAIFLLISLYLGLAPSLLVANITVLVTSFYLGIGHWTIGQMLSFSLVIFLYSLLCKIPFAKKLGFQILLLFLSGMFYGLIFSIFEVYLFQMAHFWPYYLAGVSFDFMHALGNVGFFLLLRKPFEVFNKKFFQSSKIEYEPNQ